MKTDKKQEVRSFGIISLFLLLGACVLICVPAWNGSSADTQERALRRAEGLAYQILESRNPSTRGPATAVERELNHFSLDEGQIGLDPWGQPFQFKLLKFKEFKKAKIVVWSLGPNGLAETPHENLDSNRNKSSPLFSGDDLGVMVSVK